MKSEYRWSFDDNAIGRISSSGKTLLTWDILRPEGLIISIWYCHASEVCRLLNTLENKTGQ